MTAVLTAEPWGLVLAGGGARGAFQAGILDYLRAQGFRFDRIAGTSVGGLNGILVAQDRMQAMLPLWRRVSSQARPVEDWRATLSMSGELVKAAGIPMGVANTALLALKIEKDRVRGVADHLHIPSPGQLRETIGEQLVHEIAPGRRFWVTVSPTSPVRALCTLAVGKLAEAEYLPVHEYEIGVRLKLLMATAAIPLVYPSVVVDDQRYIDGGVADNEPIACLIAQGCKRIVIAGTGRETQVNHARQRGVVILQIQSSRPIGGLTDMLDFRPKSVERWIQWGREDAERVVGAVGALIEEQLKTRRLHAQVEHEQDGVASGLTEVEAINAQTAGILAGLGRSRTPGEA